GSIDIVANLEPLLDRGSEITVLIHLLDQSGLAIIDARFAHRADSDVWNLPRAAECERKLVGKSYRLRVRQLGGKAAHESRAIVPGTAERLAEFDGVLGLKVTAA